MSDLVSVASALKNIGRKDLGLKVLNLFSKNIMYLYHYEQLSQSYFAYHDYDKAIHYLEKALALSPDPKSSYLYRMGLAKLYVCINKPTLALIYIDYNEKMRRTQELSVLRSQAESLL